MKEIRISKLFNSKSGKEVIIAIDHGLFMSAVEGLKNPIDIVRKLVENEVDAIIMPLGTFKLTKEFFRKKRHRRGF